MSYIALYRKFRPNNFDDVIGQDIVVKALKNQVKSEKISHAYLFSGTRGTGKTSMARIFAKSINCENNIDGNACGKCQSCIDISNNKSLDIIEIDAASNNGVEQMRALREEAMYPPRQGKYKVYIIDEAHMLSTAAFNALLKVLEEPPEYIVFILATTESSKIISTILSRCQRYDFRKITLDDILGRLLFLVKEENIAISKDALEYIAKKADGSLRDAISILDQCKNINLTEEITLDEVLNLLGSFDTSGYTDLITCIVNQDINASLLIFNEMISKGIDINQFTSDFVDYLRNVLLSKNKNINSNLLNITSSTYEDILKISRDIQVDNVIRYIEIFSKVLNSIRTSYSKRTLVEVAIVKACLINNNNDNGESIIEKYTLDDARFYRLENEIEELKNIIKTLSVQNISAKTDTKNKEKSKPVLKEAVSDDIKEFIKNKDKIISSLELYDQAYLRRARFTQSDSGKLKIVLTDKTVGKKILDKRHEFEKIFSQIINRKIELEVDILEKEKNFSDVYVDIEKYINMEIEKGD